MDFRNIIIIIIILLMMMMMIGFRREENGVQIFYSRTRVRLRLRVKPVLNSNQQGHAVPLVVYRSCSASKLRKDSEVIDGLHEL
jgi:predicted component of type VI protein secretion system